MSKIKYNIPIKKSFTIEDVVYAEGQSIKGTFVDFGKLYFFKSGPFFIRPEYLDEKRAMPYRISKERRW